MRSDPLLYKDFPLELRRQYEEAVRAQTWGEKHTLLLKFAETTLRYLASLSFSDYRSRCETPDQKVEGQLERLGSRNLTFGSLFALFQASVRAVPDPLIPSAESFPEGRLDALERFGAGADALETAVAGLSPGSSPAAIDVPVHVRRGLEDGGKSLDWWRGWERLVWYRNKASHSSFTNWPIQSAQYGEVMAPLLHDAIVELLTQPAVAQPILAHPVVSVTLVEGRDAGGFSNWMSGEHVGVWFEKEVVTEVPITEQWTAEHWKATSASSYILSGFGDPSEADGLAVRGLFWDLRNGLPPVMHMRVPESTTAAASPTAANPRRSRLSAEAEGRGTAPGTCGEFVQGRLPDGTPFHVSCPINKSATVIAKLRPANDLSVLGLSDLHVKLGIAIEYAVEFLDLGAVEVTVRHWSDLDIAKGMGSSTADVLSGIRAVADAVGEDLDVATQGELAAKVESSDGSMYPGIAAVNQKTCELVRRWDWYPEFVIVMLVPQDEVNTHSISFAGQEALAGDYEDVLAKMDRAIEDRSIVDFAAQSTRSADLNQRYLLNPYSRKLGPRLEEFGALGVNVGHTGTVCGLLFANTEDGQVKASDAYLKVGGLFPDLQDVKVVTTPRCIPPS